MATKYIVTCEADPQYRQEFTDRQSAHDRALAVAVNTGRSSYVTEEEGYR